MRGPIAVRAFPGSDSRTLRETNRILSRAGSRLSGVLRIRQRTRPVRLGLGADEGRLGSWMGPPAALLERRPGLSRRPAGQGG